jgi:hypothetical protein
MISAKLIDKGHSMVLIPTSSGNKRVMRDYYKLAKEGLKKIINMGYNSPGRPDKQLTMSEATFDEQKMVEIYESVNWDEVGVDAQNVLSLEQPLMLRLEDLDDVFSMIVPANTYAVVLSFPSDAMSYMCCRLIRKFKALNAPKLIAILNDGSNAQKFWDLNVAAVYPASAVSETVSILACFQKDKVLDLSFDGHLDMIHPFESSTKCNVRIDHHSEVREPLTLTPRRRLRWKTKEDMESDREDEKMPQTNSNPFGTPPHPVEQLSSLGGLGLANTNLFDSPSSSKSNRSFIINVHDENLEEMMKKSVSEMEISDNSERSSQRLLSRRSE